MESTNVPVPTVELNPAQVHTSPAYFRLHVPLPSFVCVSTGSGQFGITFTVPLSEAAGLAKALREAAFALTKAIKERAEVPEDSQ